MSIKKYEPSCEFCNEIHNFSFSRLGKIYHNIPNRIVQESENFIVIPTIGQIIPGSLLLLPKSHFETFAEIPKEMLEEAYKNLEQIDSMFSNRKTILFEHGAKKISNSSCGVYHAHIHIVPLTNADNISELVDENAIEVGSFAQAMSHLKDENNYMFFKGLNNKFYIDTKNDKNTNRFKSQYFRKWLVNNYNPQKEWDWKKYDYIEKDLINSLSISSTLI